MTTVANRKTASWVSTYNVQTPSALSVLSCCSATGCEGYSYDIASGCAVAPGSGDAYFALRPLEGLPWLGPFSNNSLDDRLNLEIAHEQIFFPDGRNVGFFNDNRVRSDNPSLLEGYRTTNTGYNPQTLMEAVNSVVPQNYELLGRNQYNCQNWAEDVRNEYHRINGR